MKFAFTVFLALVLLTLESVLIKYLHFSVTRIDVTVALITFLALRAGTLEGAFSSFAIGYLLDLSSGHSTGLYTFLGVLTFLLVRVGNSLVDVRSGVGFSIFAMGADIGHFLLAIFFTWLSSKEAHLSAAFWTGMPLQVVLTGLAAWLLYPLLRKVDPGNERPHMGTLR